jgi:NAD(P)-dependent dehydrogenase (short-subunit alcohol dehydrogenase family)
MDKTILITGVSTGLGRALAEAALADGYKVVGTVRNEQARREFEALKPGHAFGRILEMTESAAMAPMVAAVEKDIGAIHVLVNNAGYGHEGVVEESSLDDLRRQFEVNVFGAVAMMQAVLPFMRKRHAGHIINITSMGGLVTFPGVAFYHGSKFALEGISGSLGKEVASFNIHVTAVAPGMFRTDWAGRSLMRAQRRIPDYDEVFEPLRTRRQSNSGKQAGDPAKAAQAILKLIASDNPPAHLLLGPDAVRLVQENIDALKAGIDSWKDVSLSTDFST